MPITSVPLCFFDTMTGIGCKNISYTDNTVTRNTVTHNTKAAPSLSTDIEQLSL